MEGETTRFDYDAAGRRTSATYGNGTRATWAYDAVGQVLSIAYLDGAGGVQEAPTEGNFASTATRPALR